MPALHVAMYLTCAGVSVSIVVPMLLSFEPRDLLVDRLRHST